MRSSVNTAQAAKKPSRSPRQATIDRFVHRMRAGLPQQLHIPGWEAQLKLLLSHPRLERPLSGFVDTLRSIVRRRLKGEEEAVLILEALDYSLRDHVNGTFLAPTHQALLAHCCSVATLPRTLLRAAEKFADFHSFELGEFPSPFEAFKSKTVGRRPARSFEAQIVVGEAVRRAVAATLIEAARGGPTRFQSWDWHDRDAALTVLWLAYCVTRTGSTSRLRLSDEQLAEDLARCGAPLWRALLAVHGKGDPKSAESARWSEAELARVVVSASSSAVIDEDDDSAPVDEGGSAFHKMVVCRSPVLDASDKYDKDEVARHKVLERPLPLARMPSVMTLEQQWQVLLDEFPWAASSLQTIFEDLVGCAKLGAQSLKLPATLLVGQPGSGKSRLARRIAEVLAVPKLDIGLGGTSDVKVLAGTSRGWASGRPSEMASFLARERSASAIVLLDELDKAVESHRNAGGLHGYLLGLLEPETACRQYDVFLKTECDFSGISWLCTANQLSPLSTPLRTRLRILHVSQPHSEHYGTIAEAVIRDAAARFGVERAVLPELGQLDVPLDKLTSARAVRTAVDTELARWSYQIVRH